MALSGMTGFGRVEGAPGALTRAVRVEPAGAVAAPDAHSHERDVPALPSLPKSRVPRTPPWLTSH